MKLKLEYGILTNPNDLLWWAQSRTVGNRTKITIYAGLCYMDLWVN